MHFLFSISTQTQIVAQALGGNDNTRFFDSPAFKALNFYKIQFGEVFRSKYDPTLREVQARCRYGVASMRLLPQAEISMIEVSLSPYSY